MEKTVGFFYERYSDLLLTASTQLEVEDYLKLLRKLESDAKLRAEYFEIALDKVKKP